MSLISHVPLQHVANTQAIFDEIKHIKQLRLQYTKSLTKQQRQESNTYRRRFEHEYINPTLHLERIKAFAFDCYEPLNLRDNGINSNGVVITYSHSYLL
jgi:hypothetical protein